MTPFEDSAVVGLALKQDTELDAGCHEEEQWLCRILFFEPATRHCRWQRD
jgi:hypothetical protein